MDNSNEVLVKYIQESINKMLEGNKGFVQIKKDAYQSEVLENPQYKRVLKYIADFENDFIHALRLMSAYSSRTAYYENSLTVSMIDEIIESLVGIDMLIKEGIHNSCRRELRYQLELAVKLTIIDINNKELSLNDKLDYLKNNVPNSSIDYINEITLPFNDAENKQFTNEVRDLYAKLCAYVHPSKKQLAERAKNCCQGATIGFESFATLEKMSKELFRIYDIVLVLMLHGFGQSMSADLFINGFDYFEKWKFHKGKYTAMYSKLFDYKSERQIRHKI